jgi:hypothetical protein
MREQKKSLDIGFAQPAAPAVPFKPETAPKI